MSEFDIHEYIHKIVGLLRNIGALSGMNYAQIWQKTAILSRCSEMLGNVQLVTPTGIEPVFQP
jgi:hypothetical protein